MAELKIEEINCCCPKCRGVVVVKWATGPRCGVVASVDYALIAGQAFHADCWDALVKEHPPGESLDEDDFGF